MTSQTKRAVVTGGAGFIGSNLVEALLRDGWQVDIIDNLSGGKKELINPRATFYNKDVRNFEDILPVISGANVVFHLAALPRVQHSIDDPVTTNEVNAGGTLNVLHAAKVGKAGRFVYSGSCAMYGDNPTLPLREDLPPRPVSPYALQKYIGEEYARLYAELHGLPTVSFRYFNVYGPNMDPEGAYALAVGRFLKMRKEGRPITVTGAGEQTRDFVHVADVVKANILAATCEKVGRGEAINIGSGKSISILELAKMVGGPIEYIDARKESLHTLADNRKAKELLGWEPTIHIAEGIRALKIDWGIA